MNLAATRIVPFSGKEDESLTKFVESIKAACRVSKLEDALRVDCLALHLTGAALNSYHAMDATARLDFDSVVKSLKDIYEGPNKIEQHKLKFQERTLQKGEMPNALLTDLQNIAALAYPDVPKCEDGALDSVKDKRKTDQLIVEANRTARVRESFIRAMPAQYREKLMHKEDAVKVQVLCDLVERSMSIKSSCYKDAGDAFYNLDTPTTSSANEVNQMDAITQMLGTISKRLVDLENKQERKRDNSHNRYEHQQSQEQRTATQTPKTQFQCFKCGNDGHYARDCKTKFPATTQTRIKGDCFNCGKPGHMKRNCRAPLKQDKNQNQKNE